MQASRLTEVKTSFNVLPSVMAEERVDLASAGFMKENERRQ
jgi:hypothetical protein